MQRGKRRTKSRIDTVFFGVLGCFILSGFAALLYQTAWLRQFSIVFGTSELAVATVLASYMAGLAVGSAVAARLVKRVKRPVWVYGLLELGVAVGALAVPVALTAVVQIRTAWFGGQPEPPDAGGVATSLFYLLFAFLLLALPTGCMGATLPMLTRHSVHTREQIGRRVGLLYALNTAGAVLGTLFAAFVLLPTVGLWTTLMVGAFVNLLVFGIAVWISRKAEVGEQAETDHKKAKRSKPKQDKIQQRRETGGVAAAFEELNPGILLPFWVLPMMLLSGAASFTYEVLWTRLLSHILGGSIFAFATMLASFLTGITIGSAIASRFAKDRERSAVGLAVAQYATALLSIAIYYALGLLPDWAARLEVGESSSLLRPVVIAASVLLPATICIGATFPFAVRVLAKDEHDAARSSARVYAWNTVGAIAGAILAGFFLLPALKFAGVIRLAVALNLLLGVAAFCLTNTLRQRSRLIACSVCTVLILILFQPGWPEAIIRASPFASQSDDPSWRKGDVAYYGVGRSSTVLMLEQETGHFTLRTNGLPESTIAPRGGTPLGSTRMLGGLPVLVNPDAKNMLVIGFGGGVALSGVPLSVESIDVIELEPEVITGNHTIGTDRLDNPLSDPRVHVIVNDARGSLALTDKRYDAIVSQPSHPWSAGASHLYTFEFISAIRGHLQPGGVFLQWMDTDFVDHVLLKQLGATLLEVFPYVELYGPSPGFLMFIGSDEPIEPEKAFTDGSGLAPDVVEHFRLLGFTNPISVIALLALDHEGLMLLCAGAPITTDDHNFMATGSPRVIANPLGRQDSSRMMLPFDPLLRESKREALISNSELDWPYLVHQVWIAGFSDRAAVLADLIPNEVDRLVAQAIVLPRPEATEKLKKVLKLDDDNNVARYIMLYLWRSELIRGTIEDRGITAEVENLRGPEAAVVKGWKLAEAGDFEQLSTLDEQLSEAGPEHICFGDAVQLRAQWRALSPMANAELGKEAIEILDRNFNIFALNPMQGLVTYRTRLVAAALADRPHVLLQSARRLANLLGITDTADPIEAAKFRQMRQLALDHVEPLRDDPRVSQRRVDAVVQLLQASTQ